MYIYIFIYIHSVFGMVNHHFWKFLYSILTWLLLFQMEHGYQSQETPRRRVDVEENLQLYRARVIEVHRFQTFAQGGLQTFRYMSHGPWFSLGCICVVPGFS